MTIRINNNESGEGSVGSRAGRGKGQTIFVVATKRTIAIAVGEATLNSLITGVTFREVVLLGLGASMETFLVMTILNGLGQLAATYP